MCIFSCNVEDTDLVRMLVKHAHEPTSKLLHPNAVHTQICSQLFANNCSLSCVCSFFCNFAAENGIDKRFFLVFLLKY